MFRCCLSSPVARTEKDWNDPKSRCKVLLPLVLMRRETVGALQDADVGRQTASRYPHRRGHARRVPVSPTFFVGTETLLCKEQLREVEELIL